ncbi:hypothetical protein G3I60_41385 [Streptomyces sp. SID13666]|uniref:hypothetical protein n=1 Tax=unclassified Streptomyces TaxID=2593676 RepID=UPI0013BEC738|nr:MULTISPECIES: hypothetical protein [unclassified Streptomyces]NEA60450.1 hypothetical protein [Streptomyces sp. SID13666]NEA77024.1 hypothetical protein [Streptomyces sp. SID13588]
MRHALAVVGELDFAGGSNDEDDGGLLMPGTITRTNTCPALPPWMRCRGRRR